MESFDAIVVGAGPAGSTSAFVMAKSGLKVLLLERGKVPGGKNLFGGRIYSHVLRRLFKEAEKEIPVERFVVRESIGIMDDTDCATVDFSSRHKGADAAPSFVARRSMFDKWLAEKAEQAGAILVPGTKVEDLQIKDGLVTGIISGGEAIEGGCVIDAEGVTATLSRRAGLRNDVLPGQVKVGVKETIQLGKEAINDRFALDDEEGAACVYLGYPSSYLTASGAFLYTNRESVSIGVVADPVELSGARVEIEKLIENFRLHPHMRRLLKGGNVIEYSAHMIPNSVPASAENLVGNGMLVAGDAAGMFINHGFTYRGVDLAMASGEAAGLAVVGAHASGSYRREALMNYYTLLGKELLPEMGRVGKSETVLHNPRFFREYPQLALGMLEGMFGIDGFNTMRLKDLLRKNMKGKASTLRMLRDMLSAYRNV